MKSAAKGLLGSLTAMALMLGIAACGANFEKGLGNYVWIDADKDGVQDGAELGAPEVAVNVYTESGTKVDSTLTNNQGYYAFEGLDSGNYYLGFVPKEGYALTAQDATDDERDSDPDPASGRTAVFQYTAGEVDIRWDAGVVEIGEGGPPTATPTATATSTPTPTATPNAASAFLENPNLGSSDLVAFPEFANSGSIDRSGRPTGSSLDPDDSMFDLTPFYVRDAQGNLYFGIIGLTDGLSVNISMFRPGDSQFQPSEHRNIDTGTAEDPKRPSFEQGNEIYAGDPGMCLSPNAFVADLNRILADLNPEEVHSIWVYRQKADGDGYDLVHVQLTKEQIMTLISWYLDGVPSGSADLERGFAFGRLSTLSGVDIVEVTGQEAAAGLDEYLTLNPDSELSQELIQFYDCVAILFGG